ncbi:hypothetical protein HEP87_50295 [Streptomyces sp. S1D4-11]|nr:hypothetical protein [Streptomyces sp. S1D4-11]
MIRTRLSPQSVRHSSAGAGDGQRRPRRFGDVALVLVVLAHDSIVLRASGPGQGVRVC